MDEEEKCKIEQPRINLRTQNFGGQGIGIDLGPIALGMQKVIIEKVANGFIITVGCKTFVAETWAAVAGGLAEYWEDPMKAERKYSK